MKNSHPMYQVAFAKASNLGTEMSASEEGVIGRVMMANSASGALFSDFQFPLDAAIFADLCR